MSVHESQVAFYDCYRQRQSWLHDHAYLRLGKVMLIQELLRAAKVALDGKWICDFGFGAGAFFLACPPSAHLAGIELDPISVAEIRARLTKLGHPHLDLRTFTSPEDDSLPWPDASFDIVICSHVLEHSLDPGGLVERLARLLRPGGCFVALVPLNEIAQDPKHLVPFDESHLRSVCDCPALAPAVYLEADEWMYRVQPIFLRTGSAARLVHQTLSLAMGFLLCSLGAPAWRKAGHLWGRLTGSRPAQAGILLFKR